MLVIVLPLERSPTVMSLASAATRSLLCDAAVENWNERPRSL